MISEQFFKDIFTSAQISSALLLIVILLMYIAFFREPSSRHASSKKG